MYRLALGALELRPGLVASADSITRHTVLLAEEFEPTPAKTRWVFGGGPRLRLGRSVTTYLMVFAEAGADFLANNVRYAVQDDPIQPLFMTWGVRPHVRIGLTARAK